MLELSYVSTSRIDEIKGMTAPMLRISKNEEMVIAKAMSTKDNFFFLSKNFKVRNNSTNILLLIVLIYIRLIHIKFSPEMIISLLFFSSLLTSFKAFIKLLEIDLLGIIQS